MPASAGRMKFNPIDNFDAEELPPDLPEGGWKVTIKSAKMRATKKKDPMVSFEFEVTEAKDDDNESFVGKTCDDFVIFYNRNDPDRIRAYKMQTTRLRQLVEAFNLDLDVIPKGRIDEKTLKKFCEALKGSEGDIWTFVEADEQTGEQQTRVRYTDPDGGALPDAEDEEEEEGDEEEEEEETEEEEEEEEEEEAPKTGRIKKPAAKGKKR